MTISVGNPKAFIPIKGNIRPEERIKTTLGLGIVVLKTISTTETEDIAANAVNGMTVAPAVPLVERKIARIMIGFKTTELRTMKIQPGSTAVNPTYIVKMRKTDIVVTWICIRDSIPVTRNRLGITTERTRYEVAILAEISVKLANSMKEAKTTSKNNENACEVPCCRVAKVQIASKIGRIANEMLVDLT